jgi:peptide/nickel transport system ATP-binding protein
VTALLEVENLAVDLPTSEGLRRIVSGISFALAPGESLGVVGESGSGKTMTALAMMGLLPEGARVTGVLRFEGRDLTSASEPDMLALRGDRIAMIFQEPMTALNPLHRIGDQVAEPLRLHRGLSKPEAMRKAVELLGHVRLRDPEKRARAYPFELSGGERQRAMIAMALSCSPKLLIADEPTTALDVTVQAKILDLIAQLAADAHAAVMLISHDLAVIARHCERVMVMYAGEVMEEGPAAIVLGDARHPYTQALLAARPRFGAPRGARLPAIPGSAPAAGAERKGCSFAPRCPRAAPVCETKAPPVVRLDGSRSLRCARVDAEGRPT